MAATRTRIFWFRRSLRLDDNRALLAALDGGGQVVPVFVLDPAILTHPTTGQARTRFLLEALRDVDASLQKIGGRLIVRHGKPEQELVKLAKEVDAEGLYFGRDYEPYSRERDGAVQKAMEKIGVTVQTESDHLLHEPGEILSASGTNYTVFSPYKKVWLQTPIESPQDAPRSVSVPSGLFSETLPEMPSAVGVEGAFEQKPRVGGSEAEARKWLDEFLANCVAGYDEMRDYPAEEGTSRLSAYLRMGVISVRRVYALMREARAEMEAGKRTGPDTWASELAWRDFYYQIMWHYPHVVGNAFRPKYTDISWENNQTFFDAWCEGKTGYPFIDAAQRQMNEEAWMHNRARMATASFLTKDLLIDWRLGEKYFMQMLIDGDTASNNGGWQWAAGTGTDAQPFFRIFNPVTQGEKFDPSGAYIKKWIPELTKVPAKFIHSPWKMTKSEQEAVGCVLGKDYPLPIVDHKVQREKALQLYRGSNDDEESKTDGQGEEG